GGHPNDIAFDFFEQFSVLNNDSARFKTSNFREGVSVINHGFVKAKLSISAFVKRDQLAIKWSYNENFFEEGTIEKLAKNCLSKLKELILYSLERHRSGNIILTPSDFDLGSEVTVDELDKFLEEEDNIDNILSF
ncbi:MAG: Nonribosomal peptide synthetase, partial [Segetibacter sp.]|nr:Nonribosomal peptide synthetase [Segetibacter sp.]